ncbi:MAG: hypothetical protein MK185_06570 [Saccharospirillaceae bacterium]|jgi:hypothetical protein|nr:hypothetical protein [Saccharospirillaceae bacterium]
MNLRDSVLAGIKSNQKTAVVPVPEWGKGLEITVRELSLRERDKVQEVTDEKGGAYSLVSPVVMGCLDDEGGQLFQESDVETLMDNGVGPIERLYDEIMVLSGVELKKVDGDSEAVKPSEKTPDSGTTSD